MPTPLFSIGLGAMRWHSDRNGDVVQLPVPQHMQAGYVLRGAGCLEKVADWPVIRKRYRERQDHVRRVV